VEMLLAKRKNKKRKGNNKKYKREREQEMWARIYQGRLTSGLRKFTKKTPINCDGLSLPLTVYGLPHKPDSGNHMS
jgi:hypothetical protein